MPGWEGMGGKGLLWLGVMACAYRRSALSISGSRGTPTFLRCCSGASLGAVALAFSPGGSYLAVVAGDDKHTVRRRGALVYWLSEKPLQSVCIVHVRCAPPISNLAALHPCKTPPTCCRCLCSSGAAGRWSRRASATTGSPCRWGAASAACCLRNGDAAQWPHFFCGGRHRLGRAPNAIHHVDRASYHQPPIATTAATQVYGVAFNPHYREEQVPAHAARTSPRPSPRSAAPAAAPGSPRPCGTAATGEEAAPLMFASWGVKHVKLWVRAWDQVGGWAQGRASGGGERPAWRAWCQTRGGQCTIHSRRKDETWLTSGTPCASDPTARHLAAIPRPHRFHCPRPHSPGRPRVLPHHPGLLARRRRAAGRPLGRLPARRLAGRRHQRRAAGAVGRVRGARLPGALRPGEPRPARASRSNSSALGTKVCQGHHERACAFLERQPSCVARKRLPIP